MFWGVYVVMCVCTNAYIFESIKIIIEKKAIHLRGMWRTGERFVGGN